MQDNITIFIPRFQADRDQDRRRFPKPSGWNRRADLALQRVVDARFDAGTFTLGGDESTDDDRDIRDLLDLDAEI